MEIQTQRCTIRIFHPEDIDRFSEYRNDRSWMRYQGFKGKPPQGLSSGLPIRAAVTHFKEKNILPFLLPLILLICCGLWFMRKLKQAHRAEQESRIEAEIQKKRGEDQEAFLHTLSHERQMPITVMSGFAQLTAQMLEDEPVDQTAIRDNMRRMEDEAGRMERMLLDAARAISFASGYRNSPKC